MSHLPLAPVGTAAPPAGAGPAFTAEERAKFEAGMDELLLRYPEDRKQAAMLPALWLCQELVGYLTPEALTLVAARLRVAPTAAAEVATFYSMFRLAPAGRCVLEVCTNIACSLSGAERLLAHLEARLGIRVGETTPDGEFTLREVECLASCGTAPAMQVNEDFQERLTPSKLDALLESLGHTGPAASGECSGPAASARPPAKPSSSAD